MATVEWWVRHLNIGYSVGHGGMGAGAFEPRSRCFWEPERQITSPQQIYCRLRCVPAAGAAEAAPAPVAHRTARLPSRPHPSHIPPQLRGTVAVLAEVVPPDPLANIPSKNGLRSWPP